MLKRRHETWSERRVLQQESPQGVFREGEEVWKNADEALCMVTCKVRWLPASSFLLALLCVCVMAEQGSPMFYWLYTRAISSLWYHTT